MKNTCIEAFVLVFFLHTIRQDCIVIVRILSMSVVIMIYKTLLLSLFFQEGATFSQHHHLSLKTNAKSIVHNMSSVQEDAPINHNRRQFINNSVVFLSSASIGLLSESSPAFADVSDGNSLPEGAAQFGRVVRAKTDLEVRLLTCY